MVFKTMKSDRGLHGSLLFSHRAVHEIKRTAKMSGSRFSQSDYMVRSEFQNLVLMHDEINAFKYSLLPPHTIGVIVTPQV